MRTPVIRGVIERRILINYRVDSGVLAAQLPRPFRPQLVGGSGIAGICLIRLAEIRPRYLPGSWGVSSENAAHRLAVEWDGDDMSRQGVYIPRRDTSSRLNAIAGGRIFPGVHHRARFDVDERADCYHLAVQSHDGEVRLALEARLAGDFPSGSVFGTLECASQFFERGSLGYSPSTNCHRFEGLELRSRGWSVEPLEVSRVESNYFDDRDRFPAGSVVFDSALLMRNIDHEWHSAGTLEAA